MRESNGGWQSAFLRSALAGAFILKNIHTSRDDEERFDFEIEGRLDNAESPRLGTGRAARALSKFNSFAERMKGGVAPRLVRSGALASMCVEPVNNPARRSVFGQRAQESANDVRLATN